MTYKVMPVPPPIRTSVNLTDVMDQEESLTDYENQMMFNDKKPIFN